MKKIICLLLILCLLNAMIPAVFADVWIPEPEDKNEYLLALPEKSGDCYALNAFLTFFAETQLSSFSAWSAATEYYFEILLKHFELNPDQYPGQVSTYTGSGGNICMEVSPALLEQQMAELFGLKVSAEDCPGYQDSSIRVTADNFGAEKQVFASATDCQIWGPQEYIVFFEIYSAEDPERYLSTANAELTTEGLALLAEGQCTFRFEGDMQQAEFSSSDFIFNSFYISAEYGVRPYANKNLPAEAPQPSAEELPTVVVSTGDVSDPDGELPEVSDVPIPEGTPPETVPETEGQRDRDSTALILTAVAVAATAAIALAVILLVFKKKRTE